MDFDRPTESRVTLELTPLIDVIFQLLIFFMLSSTFMYPAVDLKLPELSRQPDTIQPQRLVVSVNQDGQFFINSESVGQEDVLSELKLRLGQTNEKTVFIRVDTNVAYGKFMELMDMARKAGALNYHLLYEPTN